MTPLVSRMVKSASAFRRLAAESTDGATSPFTRSDDGVSARAWGSRPHPISEAKPKARIRYGSTRLGSTGFEPGSASKACQGSQHASLEIGHLACALWLPLHPNSSLDTVVCGYLHPRPTDDLRWTSVSSFNRRLERHTPWSGSSGAAACRGCSSPTSGG